MLELGFIVCVCVSLLLSEVTILWNNVCWFCDKAVDTYYLY